MKETNTLLKRWQKAIERIGGGQALLDLPDQVKEILKNTTDLETKTKLLEAIANAVN